MSRLCPGHHCLSSLQDILEMSWHSLRYFYKFLGSTQDILKNFSARSQLYYLSQKRSTSSLQLSLLWLLLILQLQDTLLLTEVDKGSVCIEFINIKQMSEH